MLVYTTEQIEKEIRREIKANVEMAKRSDERTYNDWYYPLIKECYYILVRLNIMGYTQMDVEFDELDKSIRNKINKRCL